MPPDPWVGFATTASLRTYAGPWAVPSVKNADAAVLKLRVLKQPEHLDGLGHTAERARAYRLPVA